MYETFYGLRERPFELTSDPRFLLLTPRHREALSNLRYGLLGRKGLTVLIGEAGTGKTTVIRKVLAELASAGHRIAYLNNPTLTRDEFIEWLVVELGLDESAGGSKVRFLRELEVFLEGRQTGGVVTGLLIDEAQSLPGELLEEIRLLANMEVGDTKLLPVVLAGQPELAERLNQASLRQLKQRVALRCTLGPLDVAETAGYIAGRVEIAGGSSTDLFTREAVAAITERSGGIPRLISVICDNALVAGLALDRRPVTRDVVEEVCRSFDLPVSSNGRPRRSESVSVLAATPIQVAPPAAGSPAEPAGDPAAEATVGPEPADPAGEKRGAGSGDERNDLFTGFAARRRRFLFF